MHLAIKPENLKRNASVGHPSDRQGNKNTVRMLADAEADLNAKDLHKNIHSQSGQSNCIKKFKTLIGERS